ncbi:HYR domain-containing protein [Salegentibacter sp. BDJ18]|uniref:HYR domain-containing protein n=1 Tax=Salegentibacter sp. BDJ18 TaxID=2816376 RepID=UPI001AAF386B|nr:HYR domain-containing protein [Salegentibacter sp. BDJ18]MBO2545503.1 HYR domain-containing protein [Salegentibacter sp. BDJ18]
MKKNYFRNQFTAIRFVLITFTVLFFNTAVNAQVYKEFKQRTSQYSTSKKIYNIKGDFTMIGNTNLSLLSYGKNTNNSNNLMQFVDEDNVSSTKNSSAAVLEFSNENGANPECSNIIYAGLYWSGRTNNSGKTNAKRNIKVKGPNNSAYQTISANVNNILFPGPSDMYAAYAEVTDLVKNNGTGEYWVADMELTEGNGGTTGFYGGWGMIVIYENSQMDWRDVTVFDGYAHVEGNVVANYELPVSGFNTAQSGPVNMKMGIMAGEGDVGISGDYFQIKKNSNNAWLSLSHDQNTTNNFFNSSIQNKGSSRTPNYTNNTGIDISMFNIPNAGNSVIDNNQTSTTFRYGSTQDTYSIFSIAMSVDAYIPEIEGISSLSAINGNIAGNPPYNAVPGDELSYKVELKNKGTENVEDVKVVIPVPYNADYLPNGLSTNFYFSPSPQNNEVYFDPTLGATGSIVWEIDELPLANSTNDVLADLTIKFGVTKNCTILSNICPGFDLIRFNGNISGRGAITGTTFQNKDLIQGYETEGTCQGEPITTTFEVTIDATNFRAENCQNSDEARKFVYCNREDPIGISEINSGFPNGTRFFNESPVTNNSTEYTTNNPIPNNSGEYYAVIPGTENCAIPFTIEITTIASVPETESITYCLNDEADPLTAEPSNPDFNLYYYTSEEDTSPEIQIIPSTSQSGEFIYYVAEGESASCISPNRAPIKISVIGEPEITAPQNQTIQTCDNDFTDDSIPGLSNEFTTISQQVFTDLGGSISFTEEIESISYKDILQQQSPAVYQRIFRITYECGNIDVQQSLTLENIKTQLEPVFTKKDPTCENENGVLTITNFNTDYIYELNSTTGNLELNNATSSLSPGVYIISVALNECVFTTNSFEVLPAPAIAETPETIVVTQPTCNLETGKITVNATEGYMYSLDGEIFQESNIFEELSPGTYVIYAQNEDECISQPSKNIIIEENEGSPAQPEAIVSQQPTCEDITGTIAVTTDDGITYTLLDENENSLSNAIENGDFSDLAAGTYFVQASNGDCEAISEALVIEENKGNPAQPEAVVSQQPTCDDTTGTISVTSVQGISYNLLDENQNALTNTIENGEFSNLNAGSYFVQASNGDCEATSEAIVIEENEGSPVQPEAIVSQQPTCEDTTGIISVTTNEGISYTLLDTNQNELSNSIENGDFSDLLAGTYFIQASNGDCEATSEAIVIEENEGSPAQPEAVVSQQPNCGDATGTISVTTVDGISYTLLDANQNELSNSIENRDFSDLLAGTYFIQASNGDCEATSEAVLIEENEGSPAPPEAIVLQQPTCEDITGTISVTTDNGITYTLLDENENALNNSFEDGDFNDLVAGTYFVKASNGDCEAISEAILIEENEENPTQPEAIVSQQPTCEDTTGTILVTTDDGTTYTLLDENQNSLSNTIENGKFSDIGAGSYFVQASNGDCEAISEAIVIEENEGSPVQPEAIVSQQPNCEDITGAISVTAVDGTTYTLLDANQNSLSNSIENGEFSDLTEGTYFVKASNGDCEAISEALVIEENKGNPAQPEAIVSQQPTCEDTTGTISVTTDDGIAYTLLDENENALNNVIEYGDFSDLTAGTYFVQSSNGDCEAISEAIIIEENEGSPAQPEAIVSQEPTCEDNTGTISVITVQGITYSLLDENQNALSNSIENGEFSDLAAGTYFVQASNGDCDATSKAIIIEENKGNPAQPEAIVSQQPTCENTTGTISVTTVQGITYSLLDENQNAVNNTIENGEFSDLSAGTYLVKASNGDCETISEELVIEENQGSPAQPEAIVSQQPTCEDTTGIISVTTVQEITYTLLDENQNALSNTIENGEFINLAAGTYLVKASNGDCEATSKAIIIEENEGSLEAPIISAVTNTTCGESNGIIEFEFTEGLSYILKDSEENEYSHENGIISNLASGTYYLVAQNNDCESTVEIIVEADLDEEAPVIISCPTNLTSVSADEGMCSASNLELGDLVAEDNCDSELSITNDAPEVFEPGETIVTWTVSDKSGNITTCTQTIIVIDNQAPVIAEVETINTTTDANTCGAMITINAPEATDNCSVGNVIGTRDDNQDLNAEYPVGTTTITWTATDENGNEAELVIQTVNVEDNEAPVIAEVETINITTDVDNCGAMITINAPEATDNCSVGNVIGTRDDNQDLDAEYPMGTTTITWTATDVNGNEAVPVIQIVNVEDNQAPIIAEVETINTTTDPDTCGAMITINAPEATDNCSVGNVIGTRDDNQDLEAEYPVGTTTITWTATDENGNEAEPVIQIVTVIDDQAPSIECPDNMIFSTETNVDFATVNFDNPLAIDNCEVIVEQTGGPISGSQFPIGTTTVTFTATDSSGNTSKCSFDITIEDTEDPSLECPLDISKDIDAGLCAAVVEFETPEGFDNSGDVTVEQTAGLSSGEVFPVGTTTITFTASDSAGNTTSCSFNVTVIDDEAPVIEEKNDITVNTDPDLCGAIVEYDIPSASDDCGIESIALTKGLAPGSEFPIGQTTVTYTATDINGNSANSSFTVTVIDNESPTISCPEDITLNVEFGTGSVVVNYEAIIASDNCSGTNIELIEGFAPGEEFPVGLTTVTYKVTDAAGNSASCSFTVIVEEDLEETPPAPDAPQVEVIQPDCVTPTGVILINIEDGLTYSIDEENYYAVDEFTALEPGTYSVTARDEFDQVSEATVVTLEDPVASEIQTSTISLCTEDITFDLFELLQGDYDTSGTWVDPENTGALNQGTIDPALLQVGTYTFNYQLNNGTCNSTTEVTVSINDDCVVLPCSLEDIQSSISKAVTPNNDNHNDYFSIDFASECGFTYDVKIFNRWGSKVYEAVNYQNDWDGYSTNSITSSNQLPSGTYFYILEIRNSGFAPIQGYIYLGTK